MFGDSVVVVRAPVVRDRWDNDVADWTTATRTTVTRVVVIPTSQVEDAAGNRVAISSGWRLHSAPGVDIDLRATDRVEWQGMSLEVVGEVARYPHPIRPGHVHHVEAQLQRMTG